MTGQPVSVVLRLDGMSADLVGCLVAAGVADHFVREQDDTSTFTGSTIPLTVAEVASLVDHLAWGPVPTVPPQQAATEVIPAISKIDLPPVIVFDHEAGGRGWAFCTIHPDGEPLKRTGNGHTLACTHPPCLYWTSDPEYRYANS